MVRMSMARLGSDNHTLPHYLHEGLCCASQQRLAALVRVGSEDSDVPGQALNARLIALLLPCRLEGLGDGSCRGEGGT